MYKALLVDDEPLILDGLEYIIQWEEYGIEIAGKVQSAEQALAYIQDNHVHLLLTDIRMPGKSGLDLIEQIKLKHKDMKFIILSGYNDFELVKKAATLGIENYLVKPVNKDELSATLLGTVDKLDKHQTQFDQQIYVKEAIDILKDNVMLRLVSGNIHVHEFADKSSFLKLELHFTDFYVATLRILKDNLDAGIKTDPLLINFAIRNICEETLDLNSHLKGYVFNDSNEDIIMLLMGDQLGPEPIESFLRQIVLYCDDFLKQDVFISLGASVDSYYNCNLSYQEAKRLLDYSLVYSTKGLITSAEIGHQKQNVSKDFYSDFDDLNKVLLTKDPALIGGCIRQIFQHLNSNEAKNPSHIYNVTVEMLYTILHSANLNKNNLQNQSINGKDILADVMKRKTVEDIANSIIEVMERIFLQKEITKDSIVEDVIQYVHKHYNEQISLFTLSSTFHLNAAYLGQLFKKETGQLFTSYLNELRVNTAKDLLLNKTLKAKEVALKVGYLNPDYFYKIFKKITGIYPSEY